MFWGESLHMGVRRDYRLWVSLELEFPAVVSCPAWGMRSSAHPLQEQYVVLTAEATFPVLQKNFSDYGIQ